MGIEELKKHYQGKRVFITGHTGFKGAWLLLVLHHIGARVKGYSLAPESNSLFNSIDGTSLCESVIGDIRDERHLSDAILSFNPDYIFHMAAQALVLDSYEQPVDTFSTNIMGTVHVLNVLRSMKTPCKTVIITTDKVYENLERPEPYQENERLGGYDPYSNSKACAELVTASYRNSFFNKKDFHLHYQSIASARSGNVIGGGDWNANRIIPDLARSLSKNNTLIVRNPTAVRPWQHVLDPLRGYLMLGAHMNDNPTSFSEAFNFGPEDEDTLTVEELIQVAIDSWGEGTYEIAKNIDQPHEAHLLRLAIGKSKSMLNWRPTFKSKEAIRFTVDWYKNSPGSERAYSELQIQHFFRNETN